MFHCQQLMGLSRFCLQVYYRDFLRLCKNYKVTQADIPGVKDDGDGANERAEVKPKAPRYMTITL